MRHDSDGVEIAGGDGGQARHEGDGQSVGGIRCWIDAARHGPEAQALTAGGNMLEF